MHDAYPQALRRKILKRIENEEISITEASAEYDIHHSTIRRWVAKKNKTKKGLEKRHNEEAAVAIIENNVSQIKRVSELDTEAYYLNMLDQLQIDLEMARARSSFGPIAQLAKQQLEARNALEEYRKANGPKDYSSMSEEEFMANFEFSLQSWPIKYFHTVLNVYAEKFEIELLSKWHDGDKQRIMEFDGAEWKESSK
jgi:transposase